MTKLPPLSRKKKERLLTLLAEREKLKKEKAKRDQPNLPLFRTTLEQTPGLDFVTIDDDGVPLLHCHKNQLKAILTEADRLLVLAGWQSGKSSIGPWFMAREMKRQGPGNYLVAAPSFKLLDKYPVPGLDKCLGSILGLGEVIGKAMGEFRVSEEGHKKLWPEAKWPAYEPKDPSRIVFGHAENPDSLAVITAKGAWLDEPGQRRFKKDSHDEIRARLSTTGGRMLYTTRPYTFGWLKDDVYDRADRNRKWARGVEIAKAEGTEPLPPNPNDAGYEVVEFESIDNPRFSRQEWDQAKATLPPWVFDMKYRGKFTRPAGAIYSCFDPAFHVLPADYVPEPKWRLYCGIDYGSPNFAAVFLSEEPATGKLVMFAEYRPQESKKLADHIDAMHTVIRKAFMETAKEWAKANDKPVSEWTRLPDLCVGGSKSEQQWRIETSASHWPISPPDQPDVEVGIERVFSAIAEDKLFITRACPYALADIQGYCRPLDDEGNVLEGIEDKETWHSVDATRYIVGYLRRTGDAASITIMSY